MNLFKPATNQMAYLKAGLLGFAGSGKTFTAAELAIGLAKRINDPRPVAFFDTETGSDWMIPKFEAADVPLVVVKSRAFVDLKKAVTEAERECSILIIDSISHVWREMIEAYEQRMKRKYGLRFDDWGPIKREWGVFTDRFLNSQLHIIMCGRAGYEWEMDTDEETGKKELHKVGTKMKAETEMAYEPSLLVEMVRLKRSHATKDINDRGWIHRAVILKDRSDRMNGAEIDNPTFDSFLPHVEYLNVGGAHLGVDTSRSSEDLFDSPDGAYQRKRRVDIALEEIKDALALAELDGRSKESKRRMVELLTEVFGTSSWTAIGGMQLEGLEDGLRDLRVKLGQAPAPVDLSELPPLDAEPELDALLGIDAA